MATKLSEEAKKELAMSAKQAVLHRAKQASAGPKLSGFEDPDTRDLIKAHQFLRAAKFQTLRPLLPLLLRLKGQPYRLHNYFPFEPFFRTRMPKTVLLKTGRQVSKCVPDDEPVLTRDGWVPIGTLAVGDEVMSLDGGKFDFKRVTRFWWSGAKLCHAVKFADPKLGPVHATLDHRLYTKDAETDLEEYRCVRDIRPGDMVARMSRSGIFYWEKVVSVTPVGSRDTCDIEIAETHNYVLAGAVSHNSTSLAAQGVVFSNSHPHFQTLYVTPLFEMARRFSHNYVRQFLEESPARRLFLGTKTMNSVLQRNFKNGSVMYFSYAFLDAERTRGIPADRNAIDEIQDMQYDLLQIIHETLSGSEYGLKQYAGTPKSLDNTMEKLWTDSSQAEWVVRCQQGGCNHFNIPSVNHDLVEMIGPWHRGIGPNCPGVVCGQCQKPLDPRTGRWVHAHRDRRWSFAGYHVPQILMPMHYGNQEKWDALKGKQEGRANTTPTTFLNEVCGESCDTGSKLVTVTELKAACQLPWPRKAEEAAKHVGKYTRRILSIDWGGGGGTVRGGAAKGGEQKRERTSFTTLAVLGQTADGKVDVIWGMRSIRTHDWEYEARLAVDVMAKFNCSHLAHDYSGAGEGRLVLLYQSGLPLNKIFNIRYQGFGHNIINFHPATEDHPHHWYGLDKSRSLVTLCMAIKFGLIRFFQYDYVSADSPGLLEDFLALIEEKVDSRLGSDAYVIVRNPNKPDDFAHSVNMGACTLWQMSGNWPNVAEAAKFILPKEVIKSTRDVTRIDWEDLEGV